MPILKDHLWEVADNLPLTPPPFKSTDEEENHHHLTLFDNHPLGDESCVEKGDLRRADLRFKSETKSNHLFDVCARSCWDSQGS